MNRQRSRFGFAEIKQLIDYVQQLPPILIYIIQFLPHRSVYRTFLPE